MSINTSLSHDYVLDKIKDIKVGVITSQWNNDITLLLKNSCNDFFRAQILWNLVFMAGVD